MLPMIASRYLRALYDTAAIRRREQASFREEGESFAMMMRAGQALWRHIRQQVPQLTKLAVVAGSGNNGADGLVVAHLASEEGVTVHLYDMVQQPREGDAKRAYAFCFVGTLLRTFHTFLMNALYAPGLLFGQLSF